MSSQLTLRLTFEQIEEQIEHLSPLEQLKLLTYISERLSSEWPAPIPLTPEQEEAERQRREKEADEWMEGFAELDALVEAESDEDIVQGIHQMREEQHKKFEQVLSGSHD